MPGETGDLPESSMTPERTGETKTVPTEQRSGTPQRIESGVPSTPEARPVIPPASSSPTEAERLSAYRRYLQTGEMPPIIAGGEDEEEEEKPEGPVEDIKHIGAVFSTGENRDKIRRPQLVDGRWRTVDAVPVLDVTKTEDRTRWVLENIRVFTNGKVSDPHEKWKRIVDFHLAELNSAAEGASMEREDVRGTRNEFIAMMAIASSARAMEHSTGDLDKYAKLITGSKGKDADLGKQEDWGRCLLHADFGKITLALNNPLVRGYYNRLLADAGITHVSEGRTIPGGREPSRIEVNREVAVNGPVVRALKEGVGEGFEDYIEGVLLRGDRENRRVKWAAARIACDIFLVDKYTRWEFLIDREGDLKMKPSDSWGGDPLRSVLEPSFLPRWAKKVYEDAYGNEVLDMVDRAFRPHDILHGSLEKYILTPSLVTNLKTLSRYSKALSLFVGDSRATGLANWSKSEREKDLPLMVELLDQVYGTIKEPRPETGKQIMGALVARILYCKALAASLESARPGFREQFGLFFEEEDKRPFIEVEQFIWGRNRDEKSGFLASLVGERVHLIIKDNPYGAEAVLMEAKRILVSNDQDPRGRGKAVNMARAGIVLRTIEALVKILR